jgi:hypothetical protein
VVLRRRWRRLPAKDIRAGRIRRGKHVPSVPGCRRYQALSNPLNTRDIAAMTPLLTDDFRFILRRGNLIDKKGYLEPFKRGLCSRMSMGK